MSTAPTSHSRLSPSSSSRWLVCPYSAQLGLPEGRSKAADDGKDGHASAAYALLHDVPLFGDWEQAIVQPYVDFVKKLPGKRQHEIRIDSELIPEFGGTLDTLVLDGTHLHVPDLKTGKWKVPAAKNTQLQCYLILAWEKHPEARTFTGTIVQPAVYVKPNTAEFTAHELELFRARVAIAAASQEKVAGYHCRFCALRGMGCEEGQQFANTQNWPDVECTEVPYKAA